MDDQCIDSDEEPKVHVEVHDGRKVLKEYTFEQRMEIEDIFRSQYMEMIHDLYEKIREYRHSRPDNLFFLDKMTLNSLMEFCLSQSVVEQTVCE